MKYLFLILAVFGVLLTGCANRTDELVTTRIDVVHGANRVSLVNPKDTEFDKAEIPTPNGPAIITGYRSRANSAAIEAARIQAQAQMQMAERLGDKLESKLERLENRVATAYGFPDPTPRQQPAITVPATVVLTNAPAK